MASQTPGHWFRSRATRSSSTTRTTARSNWPPRRGCPILLDDDNGQISIKAGGGAKLVIDADGDISISGQGNVEIKAGANLSLSGASGLDLKSDATTTVKGQMLQLNPPG